MSFWRTYYHIIWATKRRKLVINNAVEKFLFNHFRQKAYELEMNIFALNGWYEHVHFVASIPPKRAVADVVKRLKGSSSYDLNQTGLLSEKFAWQVGYGVLTLGEKQRPIAEAYVNRQKEHHRQQTTNSWLERSDAIDERTGLVMREASAVYTTNPFPF